MIMNTKCVQNTLEQIQPVKKVEQAALSADDFKVTYKVLNNFRSNILERVNNLDALVKELKAYEEKIFSKGELETNKLIESGSFVEYEVNDDGFLILVKEKEPKVNILQFDVIPSKNHTQASILAADETGETQSEIKNKNKYPKSSDIISLENNLHTNNTSKIVAIPALNENDKNRSEKENNNSKEPKSSDIISPKFDFQSTDNGLSNSAIEENHTTLQIGNKNIYGKFSDQNNIEDKKIAEKSNNQHTNQTDQIMALKELKTNNVNCTENQPFASSYCSKNKVNLFDNHLKYPKPLQKTKRNRSGPSTSVISEEAWRSYYIEKENINLVKENLKKRKREEFKEKKLEKIIKSKKKVTEKNEKVVLEEIVKKKEKCAVCEDRLDSDAAEEAEKNVGCDMCPRWFQLSCTKLAGQTYDAVSDQDFFCDFCGDY